MKPRIEDASLMDLAFIASNLRAGDREELAATRDVYDYSRLAIDAYSSDYKRVAYDRDELPSLALGARTIHRGVVNVWGFATASYRDVGVAVTRYVRRIMIPTLVSQGVHRGQCIVHPNNTLSQTWLRSLGFRPEATLSGFGTRREDMILYAWVAGDAP